MFFFVIRTAHLVQTPLLTTEFYLSVLRLFALVGSFYGARETPVKQGTTLPAQSASVILQVRRNQYTYSAQVRKKSEVSQ